MFLKNKNVNKIEVTTVEYFKKNFSKKSPYNDIASTIVEIVTRGPYPSLISGFLNHI